MRAYHSIFVWSFIFTLVLLGGEARAANDVDLEVRSKVLLGQEKPRLILKINRYVNTLQLNLKSGSQQLNRSWRGLKSGKKVELELSAPVGESRYTGVLKVVFADGASGEMPLDFNVQVVAPLQITVPYEKMDLEKGKLELTLSESAGRCKYDVTFDGQPGISGHERFAGEPAGTWLSVYFKPATNNGVVLKIRLICYDQNGFYSGIDLYPWKLDIPHQDVVFASGSAEIAAEEAPKLQDALKDIGTAVRRYAKVIPIKLFVSGHTDTVGASAMNQDLSLRRAKAIAAYFRKNGFSLEIFYTGFGETHLAVATRDEVDEVRNRRALYTISVNEPLPAKWHKL